MSVAFKSNQGPRIEKLTIEQYHALPRVGKSDLDLIARSPAHYKSAKENPKEPTPAMLFGQSVHDIILEPDLFKAKYVVAPVIDRRTKAGKEEWEAFQIAHSDKTVISAEDYQAMAGILKSVQNHDTAKKLLNFGKPEQSYLWTDKETGIDCKCRPDFLRDGHIIVDVKTTEDASYDEFQKSIWNFNYHRQAAWYTDGVSAVTGKKFDSFVFVAVEKKAPFSVAVYILDDEAVQRGRDENRKHLRIFAECLQSGVWPGYDSHIRSMTLPRWAWTA